MQRALSSADFAHTSEATDTAREQVALLERHLQKAQVPEAVPA
ncbi:MAG: hypothetical protein ABIW85_05550 [Variovorax sp.]